MPTIEELGIGLIAYSPLGNGFLTGAMGADQKFADNDFRKQLPRFSEEAMQANQALVNLLVDPYRDSALLIEESDLNYTILRPGWFTHENEIDYQLTHKGESFKGHDIALNSVSDLIIKVATDPNLHVRESLGISKV